MPESTNNRMSGKTFSVKGVSVKCEEKEIILDLKDGIITVHEENEGKTTIYGSCE